MAGCCHLNASFLQGLQNEDSYSLGNQTFLPHSSAVYKIGTSFSIATGG